MAKHDTMSAWFWMTNSWLSTGGLLLFLRNPMAQRRGNAKIGEELQPLLSLETAKREGGV
ncbi:hypothetical protein EYF80_048945 [Liparis tanakae]|uniref:Uncharacterized protein n=1 Tax=Liparis tanakae TaxID=230148 RepID=A0A4Z2FIX3_9TELE|nr:hypothetical protein EYF80_048945 [Liparis tanakae]